MLGAYLGGIRLTNLQKHSSTWKASLSPPARLKKSELLYKGSGGV